MSGSVTHGVFAATLLLGLLSPHAIAAEQEDSAVLTVDHYVPWVSTSPALSGEQVELYVRERALADGSADLPGSGRVVLFVHGGTQPSVYGFDLPLGDYSWMAYLARAGFDVFAMDMTGYGWSTRPAAMEDPCNVSPDLQQQFLIPHPLEAPCDASYPFLLTTYPSQWDDIDAVVDYLRDLRQVEQVSLIGWSAGGPRFGGYSAVHPEKVDSLVLLAPVYDRNSPTDPPDELPEPGFPMGVATQLGRDGGVVPDREAACGNAYAPGMNEVVAAVNTQFDPTGAAWGPGLIRAPSTSTWGWNAETAARVQAPTLLMSGEFDNIVQPRAVRDLYEDLGTPSKVFLQLACTGHRAQHQARHKIVQDASLEWLLSGSLDGVSSGFLRKGD